MITINELLKDSTISYLKHSECSQLFFPKFPLASSEKSTWANPIVPETFLLSIPKGKVYSADGIVLVNDCLVKELLWRWSPLITNPFDLTDLPKSAYIGKKIAVIAQEGHCNYYHWIVEVLPKLAMLVENKIYYDLLYVSTHLPFMRQTLNLVGVDLEKIVEVRSDTYIQAQELIIPSAPSLSCYTSEWVISYLRDKLIPKAEQIDSSEHFFSKKVFISRKKAVSRRILNEDEIFDLLDPLGFARYHLEELTVLEQVHLFHHAEVIIAPHGAGLVNLVFSQPKALIIELFQEREDDTFWYLSQALGLNHHCIKTTEFKEGGGYTDTIIPLSIVADIINSLSPSTSL
jgi:hypothetical protein